jgi:5-methylcytosine-specific restriction endonuclease McrA
MTKEQRMWWRRYNRYLASTEWQRIRARALRHDGHRCTRCGRKGSLGNPLQANHNPIAPTIEPDKRRRGT